MPKNLQKITAASAKNIEITLVRIAFRKRPVSHAAWPELTARAAITQAASR